ncbi:MaoC family dehydratase [Rhodalgimonas zhirmunskyi]|uniref:MaoC family dehydratase n=1 Tax=Rhodalgimonas zhirmunskyi TaxID=2964767 RepID=A0AAJ1X4D1_9RHOB|nr:MaoC family dehydratase [Rhodoalgimonas zhirmunskyi]MDQ2094148.1 MaoC family dehydratase [Rhodoalgimonas zhirmunskyi]
MNETPNPPVLSLEDMRALVGKPMGTSRWYDITQDRIDQFADVTEDWQFIHVDKEAAKQTPFGTTIAHGFLTLSMLSAMVYEMPVLENIAMGVNYGFDKVRFLSPVPSGARIRAHFTLTELDESKPGFVTSYTHVEVEIEGHDKPALAADWIGRRYFGEE